MVNLRKPTHALTFLGTDLKIRGVIIGRSSSTVKIKVTRVQGGMTGKTYPHLNGSKIELPLISTVLF